MDKPKRINMWQN